MIRVVATVFRKEIVDGLRDRRGLAAAMAAVVMGPILAGVAVSSLLSAEKADARLELTVVGESNAPSLIQFFTNANAVVREHSGNVEVDVREGRLDVALLISPEYPDDFRSSRPAKVRVVSDSTRPESRDAAERARGVLERYSREMAGLRLMARGLSPDVARPLILEEVEASSAQSRAASALGVFVVYLLVATFVAGMGLAIDATAGERERTTLEALIATSAPPLEIALGKWLAVATLNVAGFLVTVAVTWAVLMRLPLAVDSWVAATIFIGVPVCCLAAALELLVATTAKSFREGQTYLSMLLMIPVASGMLVELSRTEIPSWAAVIPLVSQHKLLSMVIRDRDLDFALVVSGGVVTLAAAAAAVWYLGRVLSTEDVILGQ